MYTEQIGITWVWSCNSFIVVPLFNAIQRGSQVLEVMREGVEVSVLLQNDSMAYANL